MTDGSSGNGQRSGRRRGDHPNKIEKALENCLGSAIAMIAFFVYASIQSVTLYARFKQRRRLNKA